jgi:hypothetical protein
MGTSGYSAMIGTIGLVGSVACMGIGSLMVGKLGPKLATIIAFGGYGLLAMVYIVAPQLAMIGSVFLILSIYLNLTETLSSVCSNPLRMRLSDRRVGATQFTLYNSLSNLPVPLGASLFAWAAGAGGAAVLMPILLCMIVVGGSLFAQLRIGRPVDHEMDPIPALN